MGENAKTYASLLAGAVATILFTILETVIKDAGVADKLTSATMAGAVQTILTALFVWAVPNTKTNPLTGATVNVQELPVTTPKALILAGMIALGGLSLSACEMLAPLTGQSAAQTQQLSAEQQVRLRIQQSAQIVTDAQDEVTFLLNARMISVQQAQQVQAYTARADELVKRAAAALESTGGAGGAAVYMDAAQDAIRQMILAKATARTSK